MRYLILAQSEYTASALQVWLELAGSTDSQAGRIQQIVYTGGGREGEAGVICYETLVRRMEEACRMDDGSIPLNQTTVLVDAVSPSELSAVQEGYSWTHVVSLLILTFPEIKWVFGVVVGEQPEDKADFDLTDHGLPSLFQPRREPLFDPTGLREHIKRLTRIRVEATTVKIDIPERALAAAAVDEEKAYAYFHAYTAWRFGYRVDTVTSWSLMARLFHDPNYKENSRVSSQCDRQAVADAHFEQAGPASPSPHGYHLLLEDLNLNFPDRPQAIHLSDLRKERAKNCNRLHEKEKSTSRIIITSGQTSREELERDNISFLQKKAPRKWGIHYKPLSGMFGLWASIGQLEDAGPAGASSAVAEGADYLPVSWCQSIGLYFAEVPVEYKWRSIPGGAPANPEGKKEAFQWPPARVEAPAGSTAQNTTGHSAPGKLMLVAEHLLRRAQQFRENARTVKDCIKGAVLATEAMELLAGLTPTLSLQAMALKHEYEVMAEICFIGSGGHFDVKRRAFEVRSVAGALCRNFQGREPNRVYLAALDAEMVTMNRLALVFRNAGQFDEEEEAMIRVRRANRSILLCRTDVFDTSSRPPRRRPTCGWRLEIREFPQWIGNMILLYAEWLLARFRNFLIAGLALGLPSFILWKAFGCVSAFDSISGLAGAVFGGNPHENEPCVPSDNWGLLLLSVSVIIVGVFHLGVFVSYLYTKVSRR